jgi:hypothetical protein
VLHSRPDFTTLKCPEDPGGGSVEYSMISPESLVWSSEE